MSPIFPSGPRSSWSRARLQILSLVLLTPVLLLAGCDEPPEIQNPVPLFDRVPIEYPAGLWADGVEGTTLIRVLVGKEGGVDSVLVMETSGHQAFDSAAVEGARLLRFEPALQEGEPIQVWAQVPVHFTRTGSGERTDQNAGPAGADSIDSSAPSGTNP